MLALLKGLTKPPWWSSTSRLTPKPTRLCRKTPLAEIYSTQPTAGGSASPARSRGPAVSPCTEVTSMSLFSPQHLRLGHAGHILAPCLQRSRSVSAGGEVKSEGIPDLELGDLHSASTPATDWLLDLRAALSLLQASCSIHSPKGAVGEGAQQRACLLPRPRIYKGRGASHSPWDDVLSARNSHRPTSHKNDLRAGAVWFRTHCLHWLLLYPPQTLGHTRFTMAHPGSETAREIQK